MLLALGTLLLLAAASWLPARAVRTAAGAEPAPAAIDLARPALPVPATFPVHAPTAVGALQGYFFSLAGARPGGGEAPYAAAYGYLDPGWRARLPFARFIDGWREVAHLDLLQAVDAGPVPYNPRARRVFAEVREYLVLPQGQVVAFAAGAFTAAVGRDGWLLTDGKLEPEALVANNFGGGTSWRRNPAAVARAEVAGQTQGDPVTGEVRRQGHLATVSVSLPSQPGNPGKTLRAHLTELVDGTWRLLYLEP